jgi:hypothetical protein
VTVAYGVMMFGLGALIAGWLLMVGAALERRRLSIPEAER